MFWDYFCLPPFPRLCSQQKDTLIKCLLGNIFYSNFILINNILNPLFKLNTSMQLGLTSITLREPSFGTKAVIFFPFLINCTLTHFRIAELGCLASTPLKQTIEELQSPEKKYNNKIVAHQTHYAKTLKSFQHFI